MSLSDAQKLVREFAVKFGVAAPDEPQSDDDVDWDTHDWRMDWIASEIKEGNGAETVHDMADAYVDIIYLALGGLVSLGVDGGPLFEAVHAANMTKIKLPGVSKIAKGPDFKHPDIATLIEQQKRR